MEQNVCSQQVSRGKKREKNVKYWRICVCMLVCACVCSCMHVCRVCVCLHALARVFVRAFVCICVCFVRAQVFACVRICVYLCMHVCVHACIFVCICLCVHLYVYVHACRSVLAFTVVSKMPLNKNCSVSICFAWALLWSNSHLKPCCLVLGRSLCPSLCPVAAGEQEVKLTAPLSWGLRLPHRSSKIDALLTEFNNLAL